MQALDTLLSRVSVGALAEPAPSGEALDRILQAGLCAPDHGGLAPWRFMLIRGAARAAFADVIEAALRARDPDAPAPLIDKQRGKFLRAPLVIALGARIREGHKVPVAEQLLAVGAGAMNLLNAAHALGFGAIWVSGANAADPAVAAALGLAPPDRLLGFLLVGTPAGTVAAPGRPALTAHVTEWKGACPSEHAAA
ncbi:nitroreductase family protein [Lichenicoccus sp.]|uniref:nitroreductase family protein n=1 Tax=Lichenicoccus sp. TaxID=2781899 RepID=UPI003D0C859B